jgi:lysophospholipase L1-like esterase
MNPVVLYFASGESLYSGGTILFFAIAVSPLLRKTWERRLRNIAAWLGLVLMVMASPPFSWGIASGFLAAYILWFSVECSSGHAQCRTTLTTVSRVLLAVLALVLCFVEFHHRREPTIVGFQNDHMVVIGDSISAGLDPHISSWPKIMQEMTGVPVGNLARPGADLSEGLMMATEPSPSDHVVLLELGGNDLLSGVPSKEFARRLEAVLTRVASRDRVVAMFELPLLPVWISHGRSQRQLASKYGVYLIRKRDFAAVISGGSATIDGLHLSETGTRRMALLVARTFSPVLGVSPHALH